MTFFKFSKDDILHTTIRCFPAFVTENNGQQVTGSVFLERPFLETNLRYRIFEGFSQKQGGGACPKVSSFYYQPPRRQICGP